MKDAYLAEKPDELHKELADLQEVLDALIQAIDISQTAVRQKQAERRALRGGFKERLALLWVEEPNVPKS